MRHTTGSGRHAALRAIPVVLVLAALFVPVLNAAPAGAVGGNEGEYHPLNPARLYDSRGGDLGRPLNAGETVTVTVAKAGVPTDGTAEGVVLNVTGIAQDGPSYLTVYPNGSAQPDTSSVNLVKGQPIPNAVFARVGTNGQVRIFNQAGASRTHVIVDVLGWFGTTAATDGTGFKPLPPVRVIDTRQDPDGPLQDDEVGAVNMAGVIPGDATAVLANVTAIATATTDRQSPPAACASTNGYLTVMADPDGDVPNTSTVNFLKGQIVPNLAIMPTKVNATSGAPEISVYNFTGCTDVVIDVFGFFGPTGTLRFVPGASPKRLLDTRTDGGKVGTSGRVVNARPAGVPSTAQAVVLNGTVTDPDLAGFLKVTPPGATGDVSNLNFTKAQTVANGVVTGVDTGQNLQLTANVNTQVVLDVIGWFEPAAA